MRAKHWMSVHTIFTSQIAGSKDIDTEMDSILEKHQQTYPHAILHTVAYY